MLVHNNVLLLLQDHDNDQNNDTDNDTNDELDNGLSGDESDGGHEDDGDDDDDDENDDEIWADISENILNGDISSGHEPLPDPVPETKSTNCQIHPRVVLVFYFDLARGISY